MTFIDESPIMRDGKSLILAYDHGLEHGPSDFEEVPGSEKPRKIFEIAKHDSISALAVQKGLAEQYYPEYEEDVNLIVKLNGTSNLWDTEPYSPLNCTVERAAELGADAVGYTMFAGSNREDEMFETFRYVQEEAHRHDLPVIMWAYPRGSGVEDDRDPNVINYAARIGLELGADMVKVKYPGSGDAMEKIADVTGKTKVVMSGGSKTSDKEFLSNIHDTIAAGGDGLAVGRNVFQREDPEDLLEKIEEVIYNDKSPEEVL